MFKFDKQEIISKLESLVNVSYSDFVALDIGSINIKAIYVNNKVIQNYFFSSSGQDPATIIKSWLSKEGLLNKPIKLVIKGQDTLIRYIPFPRVEYKTLHDTVGLSLSQFIPFNKEEVSFGVAIAKENYSPKEDLVLLAASKKNYIEEAVKGLTSKGLSISEVTLSNVALINFGLYLFDNNKNIALIDFGISSLLINVINKGHPLLSREIKISSEKFFKNITTKKNLSGDQITKFLLENEDLNQISELGEELWSEVFEEIKNSMDYFELNYRERIEEVYISGGLSRIKVMPALISQYLGVNALVLNPWDKIKPKCNGDFLKLKEFFSLVIGLSL